MGVRKDRTMLDLILETAVIVLPTVLSLVGVFVSIKAPQSQHHRAYRAVLIIMGIFLSIAAFWQQSRTKASHDAEIIALTKQIETLTGKLDTLPSIIIKGIGGSRTEIHKN